MGSANSPGRSRVERGIYGVARPPARASVNDRFSRLTKG
jgi:hypothetical protein